MFENRHLGWPPSRQDNREGGAEGLRAYAFANKGMKARKHLYYGTRLATEPGENGEPPCGRGRERAAGPREGEVLRRTAVGEG